MNWILDYVIDELKSRVQALEKVIQDDEVSTGYKLSKQDEIKFLQMELEYIDGNIRAEKFYKKMGFTEFARRPDAVRIGGVSRSDVWMLRRL